jgi:hypothetical protein
MRHFFVSRPITTLSRGMAASPCRTILVALAGALLRTAPDPLGTAFGTINLAAVAAAADQHLHPTARAGKQPRRSRVGMVETAIATWTTTAIAGILPLHACPARVGHGVDAEPPSLRSAPCLPLESSKLLRATQSGSSARRRPAEQQHQLSIGSPFEAPLPARANAGKRPGRHPAPDRRGFRPPSTSHAAARTMRP